MSTKATQSGRALRAIGFLIGLGLITAGGYFLATSLAKSNGVIKAPTTPATKQEGKDVPKTAAQRQLYNVPPTHPRELIIPKLSVDAIILPMGTTNNVLNAPLSAWDVGWYDQSDLPGSNQGALLIDGHVNDALNTPGIFYKLNTLLPGDQIIVGRGDGQQFTYTVVKVEQVPIDQVDMSSMLRSVVPGHQGLNLITCGGTYDSKEKTYNDRILIYAVQS